MSYTPTVWNKGDIITVAKLNKIENGIAANNYDVVFTFNYDTTTLSGIGLSYNDLKTKISNQTCNALCIFTSTDAIENHNMIFYASRTDNDLIGFGWFETEGIGSVMFNVDGTGEATIGGGTLSMTWSYDSESGEYTITPTGGGGGGDVTF